MEALPSQNHTVFSVFEEWHSHEKDAGPDQMGHGLQAGQIGQSCDDGCKDGGGDGGTWGHRLTKDQERKSLS